MSNQNQFQDTRNMADEDVFRLQKEIVIADRKLIERMMNSTSKGREALYPILQEVANTQKNFYSRQSDLNVSKDELAHNDSKNNLSANLNASLGYSRDRIIQNSSEIMSKNFERSGDIRYMIKKIFGFYVSFGDRLNANYLKANKLYKMMHDAYILDENINQKRLDLLFSKHSKNRSSIDFECFLSLVINLATLKFPSLDPKDGFLELFNQYLKPLYNGLYTETDLGEFDIIFKEPFEEETIDLLRSIAPVLSKLHKIFFEAEYQQLDLRETRQRSESALYGLLKDFELCPGLLNVSVGNTVLQEVMDIPKQKLTQNPQFEYIVTRDEGRVFTLNRFITFLTRIALVVFSPLSNETLESYSQIAQCEKVLLLLEKMEFSMGFVSFEKKMNRTHHSSISLLPSKYAFNKLNDTKNQSELYNTRPENTSGIFGNSSTPHIRNVTSATKFRAHDQPSEQNLTSTIRSKTPNPHQQQAVDDANNQLKVLKDNHEVLQKLFRTYCSYAVSGNKWLMKTMKFIKMLKDANLIKDYEGNNQDGQVSFHKSPSHKSTQKRLIDSKDVDLFLAKLISTKTQKLNFSSSKGGDFRSLSPQRGFEDTMTSPVHGKLGFEQFIKSLRYVAIKLYQEFDEESAIQALVDNHLYDLVNEKRIIQENIDTKSHLKRLMQILKDPAVVDILGKMKKSLHAFYLYYCEEDLTMDFERFMKFCKDFDIFPNVLPRAKIMQLFLNLSSLYPFLKKEREKQDSTIRPDSINLPTIDENLFVEALALCAAEIEDKISAHIVDKISYLLERMGEASGPKNAQKSLRVTTRNLDSKKATYEVIHYIRNKYSNIIEDKREINQSKRKIHFQELFLNEKP